jgi:hypothetical protein
VGFQWRRATPLVLEAPSKHVFKMGAKSMARIALLKEREDLQMVSVFYTYIAPNGADGRTAEAVFPNTPKQVFEVSPKEGRYGVSRPQPTPSLTVRLLPLLRRFH